MNQAKFENLVLLICNAVPDRLITTRLNKLLWLIDKTAFVKNGKKITGCPYFRKQHGPVPRDNGEALAIMRDNKLLSITTRNDDGRHLPRREYHALQYADKSVFSAMEMELITETLAKFSNWSTMRLVKLSHDLLWANRDDGEEINFEAYLTNFNFSPAQQTKMLQKIESAELEYEE